MLLRLLITGLISGVVAGAVATIFHFLMVQPLILEAEKYEIQAPILSTPEGQSRTNKNQDGLNQNYEGGGLIHDHDQSAKARMQHQDSNHTPQESALSSRIKRGTFTLISNVIVGIAFGILLATGLTLYGHNIGWVQGIGWGISGFLAFSLLPALGLPPEAPGSAVAELFPRQVWWLSTAFASAIGIALIVFNPQYLWKTAGISALIVPHLIGAPKPNAGAVDSVPPDLAAHFVVNTLIFTAVMWLMLGLVSSYVLKRLNTNDKIFPKRA